MKTTAFPLVIVAALGIGCSQVPEPDAAPVDDFLAPPPPGAGVQYRMVGSIAPGREAEWCQFFRAPPDGLNINHDEVAFAPGSHHVLLLSTDYQEIPTKNIDGDAVNTTGPFDCSDGVAAHWSVSGVVAGSQNVGGESLVDFPEDVAMRVPPNAVLLMNAHYINATPKVLEPEVRINVYTIPDERIAVEGGLMFFYNPFIRVDPKKHGRTAMACPIPEDITFGNMQSHMHARGVDFATTVIDPEGQRTTIYENGLSQGVPVEHWDDGLSVAAGSRIEYFCGYENTADRTVWQGATTSDEMCVLLASYWPARPFVSYCSTDPDEVKKTSGFAADWIGNGTSSCPALLGCLQGVPEDPDPSSSVPLAYKTDVVRAVTDCMLAVRPESSSVASNLLRCGLAAKSPVTECQPEIAACLADNE